MSSKDRSTGSTWRRAALGLHGKVLVPGRRAVRVSSVRRHQELTPCRTQTVPSGSNSDLSLPKADPIIETGGFSVITYLRKVKKHYAAARREG